MCKVGAVLLLDGELDPRVLPDPGDRPRGAQAAAKLAALWERRQGRGAPASLHGQEGEGSEWSEWSECYEWTHRNEGSEGREERREGGRSGERGARERAAGGEAVACLLQKTKQNARKNAKSIDNG